MKSNLFATIGCLFLFCGCSSDVATIQNQKRIAQVTSWQFVYSTRTIASSAPSNQSPATIDPAQFKRDIQFPSEAFRSPGQAKGELRFSELIFTTFRNRVNVPVTNDTSEVRAQIRLQAVMLPDGGLKYPDVALYDADYQLLAETVIPNDREHQDTFTFNGNFAEYAAGKIAELLGAHSNEGR
jgi:hypothetical protein